MSDMENPTPIDKEPTDPAAVPPPATTDPAAPPRTTTLDPVPVLPVGGSTALTSGLATRPRIPRPMPAASSPSSLLPPLATENGEQATPQITIDDFAKVELRVAQILVAERIPKADKLLRLEVDLGEFGKRQILSGIAEWYAPEDLIGRRIVVITNLAPRKMRGLESHGMLLAASEEGGKPFLATVPEGAPVGTPPQVAAPPLPLPLLPHYSLLTALMLIDSHCHLDDYEDLPAILAHAREAGVEKLLAIGIGDGPR